MQIAIEYIKWLREEYAKINKANLDDIEFFENGMKVDIGKKILADFKYTGLNNTDFITSGFYIDGWADEPDRSNIAPNQNRDK